MSNYAIMTAEKYEELKARLQHGHRKSVDESKVVAKLEAGQEPVGTEIHTHSETLTIMATSEWTPDETEVRK
ncbi:MAG TPA: hypothetical protein DCL39_05105, partial [Alteromonas macleodii]|nr:hypothetical protein [Alteromonas macleodii]HAM19217.1 hypothetical protein [Alteromonas macleodii]|tara:strand:- start:4171 stop:4386 length:216 start_codon:yes stop_codon:yes gene_type:complete